MCLRTRGGVSKTKSYRLHPGLLKTKIVINPLRLLRSDPGCDTLSDLIPHDTHPLDVLELVNVFVSK